MCEGSDGAGSSDVSARRRHRELGRDAGRVIARAPGRGADHRVLDGHSAHHKGVVVCAPYVVSPSVQIGTFIECEISPEDDGVDSLRVQWQGAAADERGDLTLNDGVADLNGRGGRGDGGGLAEDGGRGGVRVLSVGVLVVGGDGLVPGRRADVLSEVVEVVAEVGGGGGAGLAAQVAVVYLVQVHGAGHDGASVVGLVEVRAHRGGGGAGDA